MENISFIKFTDKLTNNPIVVATDLIISVEEMEHVENNNLCKVCYTTPNSEIDYVIDTITNIAQSFDELGEQFGMAQLLDGRIVLFNYRYVMRLHTEGDDETEPKCTVITPSNGTSIPVQDTIEEILNIEAK
jgi:hypothetical protein